jgi:hypothetical protein
VPVVDMPPVTVAGLNVTDDRDRVGGFTVSVAFWVLL